MSLQRKEGFPLPFCQQESIFITLTEFLISPFLLQLFKNQRAKAEQPTEDHNNSGFLVVYEMKKTVEDLLQSSYWIIDILPSHVPEDSPGQFFSVEEYFLQGDRIEEIKQKHIDLVLKLNCYRDISISDETVVNPLPKHIADEMKKRYLYIMLGESMILSEPDDTHLTVFIRILNCWN
jgi:hypothetical protein